MARTSAGIPVLLKVMSILVIIVGVFEIIAGLIGVFAGGAITYAGSEINSGLLMGVGIAVIVLSLIGGILEFVAGINSVKGKHLGFCLFLAVVTVAISVIVLCMALGSDTSTIVTSIVAIVFNVLYLLGVIQGRKQLG